jgi:hypothetical protein
MKTMVYAGIVSAYEVPPLIHTDVASRLLVIYFLCVHFGCFLTHKICPRHGLSSEKKSFQIDVRKVSLLGLDHSVTVSPAVQSVKALQTGRSRVRFPTASLKFFIDIMAVTQGSTQPVAEMSTTNISWG